MQRLAHGFIVSGGIVAHGGCRGGAVIAGSAFIRGGSCDFDRVSKGVGLVAWLVCRVMVRHFELLDGVITLLFWSSSVPSYETLEKLYDRVRAFRIFHAYASLSGTLVFYSGVSTDLVDERNQ